MGKPKRKLNSAEKLARKERRKQFMTVFVNGKTDVPPKCVGLRHDNAQ